MTGSKVVTPQDLWVSFLRRAFPQTFHWRMNRALSVPTRAFNYFLGDYANRLNLAGIPTKNSIGVPNEEDCNS